MEFSLELILASLFTVLCILLALIYRHVCKLYMYFDKLEISGPVPSFLLGTWKEAPEKFLGDFDIECARLYGKVYGTFDGLTPNLMVIEPDVIKQILETHADKFVDRRVADCRNPILKKCLEILYGEDGEGRALTNLLPKDSIEKLLPRIESSADTVVQTILKRKEEGVGFNFISIVNDYIHDLIASIVFGIDLNSDVTFRDEFVSYCNQIFSIKNPNSKLALVPVLFEKLQGDSWILPQKALEYFVNLIKTSINDTPKGSVLPEGKAANLIELLMAAANVEENLMKIREENELILTEEFIIAKSLATIFALVNAAKSVVLLTIQCLGNQLEIQDELSSEVKKNKEERLPIDELKILDMVISEVLRLHPSEFRVEKVCKNSVTIDKFSFVKGNRVSVPLFALHRQEDFYPEQDKFDPRRFSEEAIKNRNRFTYLPFGHVGVNGVNISVRLVVLASKILIVKLVDKLKFKAPDNSNRIFFKRGITGVPKVAALNITTEVKN